MFDARRTAGTLVTHIGATGHDDVMSDHQRIRQALTSPRWLVERSGDQVRVFYDHGHGPAQYAALHLRDSYFRLSAGPSCGWGTSVILMPVFWCQGICHHGAPVTATWRAEGSRLTLALAGTLGGLYASLTVSLSPPTDGRTVAYVHARVDGDLALDDRPGERFKPVMLSSMYASPALWDAHTAQVGRRSVPLPLAGWVVPPEQITPASSFSLIGGTSHWKANAPTVSIALDRSLPVTGWVTRSDDPNDDSVGLWAAADSVIPSYSYRITASLP